MYHVSSISRRTAGFVFALALALSVRGAGQPGVPSASELNFFESRIRPLLVENCYKCHSHEAEKVKGGLLLDSRDGLLKGGDSGPAIVPGDPGKSLLIKAVRYTDADLQMPPKNRKLPSDQIAALEEWVKMGAPEPLSSAKDSIAKSHDSAHWAFQPVKRPALPAVKDEAWVQDPMDSFVLAKLEAGGLSPSPKADKRTLIRRVTYDLTGLPPTPDEVRDFVSDVAPDAYTRLVERLLSSPEYGERWARHWLDVARYADTKGYVFEEERRYAYAYTYRDYVVNALNQDLPYDQFIVQQLAADQLPLGEDQRPLAALGFLTLGRRFLNNQHDIIDDRIDVVTRGLMGLTVACARCHDHKFDPITTKDYYSLYGVFASCSEPEEEPLLGTKALPASYNEYLKEHAKRSQEVESFRKTKEAEVRAQVRRLTGDYLLAAYDTRRLPDKSKAEGLARERKLDPHTVQRWADKMEQWSHEPSNPVFAPWLALAQCDSTDWPGQAEAILRGVVGTHINPLVAELLALAPPESLVDLAQRYGTLFDTVDLISHQAAQTHAPLSTDLVQIAQVLDAPDSPTAIPDSEITRLFDVPSIQKLRALRRKLDELDATHPGAPPRAMALRDNPVPDRPHVLLRGNPNNPGPEVPRQFIALLAGGKPKPFEKGSGRLELAQAIASRQNPLTARVLVNRVWLQYFGAGLVRTPSDFGMRSEPPTHPELLDYLAARFMDEGWSLKKLQRWIVLSSTYQQTSDDQPRGLQVDPSNRLLWKMPRRRLDFEATRDSLLAASGELDLSEGGHAVDILSSPFTGRRTLYGFVERQNLPGLFRTFDFASPDTTSPQRFSTTVPQQGLFMLNSPFVVHQVEALMARPEIRSASCDQERIQRLYEIAYQRQPTTRELELATKFLGAQGEPNPGPASPSTNPNRQDAPGDQQGPGKTVRPLTDWERYAQVLLMANEFVFLD